EFCGCPGIAPVRTRMWRQPSGPPVARPDRGLPPRIARRRRGEVPGAGAHQETQLPPSLWPDLGVAEQTLAAGCDCDDRVPPPPDGVLRPTFPQGPTVARRGRCG